MLPKPPVRVLTVLGVLRVFPVPRSVAKISGPPVFQTSLLASLGSAPRLVCRPLVALWLIICLALTDSTIQTSPEQEDSPCTSINSPQSMTTTPLILRATITILGNGSTSGPQVYCCLAKDDDLNTNYTSVADVISDDVSSYGVTGGVDNKPLVLRASFNAKKTYGITSAPTDPTMSGGAASNPAEQTYYRLSIQEAGFSATVTCNFLIVIDYDCVWRNVRMFLLLELMKSVILFLYGFVSQITNFFTCQNTYHR